MNPNKKKTWVKFVAMVIIVAMLLSVVASIIVLIMNMNKFPLF